MKDIEESLNQGYPDYLKYKLFDRKAKSLVQLKQFKEAMRAYEDTIDLLQTSNLEDNTRTEWQESLENKIDEIQKKCPSKKTIATKEDKLEHSQVTLSVC